MQRQPSMGGVFLRAAVAPDLPQIVEMLHGAGLIVAGVEDHLGAFLVAADGERVIGAAGRAAGARSSPRRVARTRRRVLRDGGGHDAVSAPARGYVRRGRSRGGTSMSETAIKQAVR